MATEQPTRAISLSPGLRAEQIFPTLTPAQIGQTWRISRLQAIAEGDPDVVCLVETDERWVGELAPLERGYRWVTKYPLEIRKY